MKLILENTTKTVTLNGVECRIWEGETASGIKCHAFIARIGVHENLDASQFAGELEEQRTPSPEIQEIPLRMIL